MEWKKKVDALIAAAENEEESSETMRLYAEALSSLPEDAKRSTDATQILTAMGERSFLDGKAQEALEYFSEAVACEGGLGLSHIHLRLGQLRADRGELDRARDELMRAYMGSGKTIFEFEDPKYYALIEDIVEKR